MQKILITLSIIASFFLSGCAYKIDIQQGNVVTQEQLAQLQPGLDKRQVRLIVGTPMLIDPFHPDRWDYYYSHHRGDKLQQRYLLTLYFSGEKLSRIEHQGEFPTDEYQGAVEE